MGKVSCDRRGVAGEINPESEEEIREPISENRLEKNNMKGRGVARNKAIDKDNEQNSGGNSDRKADQDNR